MHKDQLETADATRKRCETDGASKSIAFNMKPSRYSAKMRGKDSRISCNCSGCLVRESCIPCRMLLLPPRRRRWAAVGPLCKSMYYEKSVLTT